MSFRGTLLLALIAATLGLYVYLVEIRGERERAEAEAEAKKILSFKPDEITVVELDTSDGGRARLVREGDAGPWRLETPVAYAADQARVEELLETLTMLASESVIDEVPEDLGPFGLGVDAKSLRLHRGEALAGELLLGGPAPIGAARYVALAEPPERIFTASSSQVASLLPRLIDLRDKRIVQFELEQIHGLRVLEHGSAVAALERTEAGEWKLVEPIEDRGDTERIERLLKDLVLGRAMGFVDDPGELSSYGLDPPEITLELETEGGPHAIALGRVQDKGYIRVDGKAPIFEVSDRIVMNAPRRVFAFRYKRVLELDADAVARLEIRFPRDEASYVLVREERRWKARDPELRLKPLSVEDLLWALDDLDATGVIDESRDDLGLDPPRVRVRALDGDGTELGWLELGDPLGADALPARSSTSERIWKVSNELGKDVPLGLEAFEQNFVEPPEGSPVESEPAASATDEPQGPPAEPADAEPSEEGA
ncbi:MAG: DUF4340 domain-containing protein [Myxococcota bacterium]